ncbi:hypothetical protein [uncultured Erythrobacter sp.]|uniref:hypothetical protein n=1 Tax=uncultured Erythrobacter sp. TaxID=263913 RepID=UPI002657E824|nr:hypothetical protein [uncultured Erythrobacter sp.]
MKALAAALAVLLAQIPAVSLGAEEPPAWRAVDPATGAIADVAGLEQLARDFPDSANVRLRFLNAQLQAGDGDAALVSLRWLVERGHQFGERARGQIPDLIGAAQAEAARELLAGVPQMIAASTVFAEVQAEAGLIESVFVAPNGVEALATSVSRRSVFVSLPGDAWKELPIPGAFALSGIVSASDGRTGWIASGNIDGSPADPERFSGLIGLTGEPSEFRRIPAPEGVAVSDLAVGLDGTVYASDPQGGGVYRARADAPALEPLIAPGILRSPQGLAVSADGARLYVSDYRYGLAVIDLANGALTRLSSDVPAALDGVDGLWLHGRELIAVQNGTSPMRISAFALSEDGTRIIGHRILEQAHPDWTEPLGGSVAKGALYYVATGQWDRYDQGRLRDGMTAIPSVIRRLPLAPR